MARFTLSLVCSALLSHTLLATNGDNFIALGTASQAMGGTGIAHYSPGASATGNPALITKAIGGEFTFGGTYLAPSVKTRVSGSTANNLSTQSSSKNYTTPYAALTYNLGNGFSVGGSMFGAAGMGTDWTKGSGAYTDKNTPGLYSMKSNLTMFKVSAPVGYVMENWSIGFSPVILFGTLGLSYADMAENPDSDTGFGFEVGTTYTFKDTGLTLGAVYHSSILMSYNNQISTMSRNFGYGVSGANFGELSDDLEQPAEYGAGIDWTYGPITLSADYRRIIWGSAAGYREFNWENQDIYALGLEYRIDALSLRAGYNYGKNPIKPKNDDRQISTSSPATNGDVINTFNHVMFPAITEKHYSIGVGYQFNESVTADVALIYATSPKVSVDADSLNLGTIRSSNDQISASAALNVLF